METGAGKASFSAPVPGANRNIDGLEGFGAVLHIAMNYVVLNEGGKMGR
jgi:hypothetical protein